MDINNIGSTPGLGPAIKGSAPRKTREAEGKESLPGESFKKTGTADRHGIPSKAKLAASLKNAVASGVSIDDLSKLFDVKTGPLWTYRFPEHPSPKHGMKMGTDGSLYTGAYKTMVKLDPATGKEAWKKTFENEIDSYPFTEAKDGSLLVMFGYDRLVALDPDTGNERWHYDVNKVGAWDPQPTVGPDGSIFTFRKDKLAVLTPDGKEKFKCRVGKYSPSVIGVDSSGQSVVMSGRELVVYSPKGKELWRAEGDEGYFYQKNRDQVLITTNEKIAARNRETGEIQWERPYADLKMGRWPPLAAFDGKLLLTDSHQRTNLACLDAATGNTIWESPIKNGASGRYVQVFEDQKLLTVKEGDRFSVIDADTGKEKWAFDMPPSTSMGSQALSPAGILYVQMGKVLYGFDAATGKPISQNDSFDMTCGLIPGKDGHTLFAQDYNSLNVMSIDTRSIDEKVKSLSEEIQERAGECPESNSGSYLEVTDDFIMIDDVKIERHK